MPLQRRYASSSAVGVKLSIRDNWFGDSESHIWDPNRQPESRVDRTPTGLRQG
jgi:hypothetical protein